MSETTPSTVPAPIPVPAEASAVAPPAVTVVAPPVVAPTTIAGGLDPAVLSKLAVNIQAEEKIIAGLSAVESQARGALASANAANAKRVREFAASQSQTVAAQHQAHNNAAKDMQAASEKLAAARKALDLYIATGKAP